MFDRADGGMFNPDSKIKTAGEQRLAAIYTVR